MCQEPWQGATSPCSQPQERGDTVGLTTQPTLRPLQGEELLKPRRWELSASTRVSMQLPEGPLSRAVPS